MNITLILYLLVPSAASPDLYLLAGVPGGPLPLPGLVRAAAPHLHARAAALQPPPAGRGPRVGGQRQEADHGLEILLAGEGGWSRGQLAAHVPGLGEGEGLRHQKVASRLGPAHIPLEVQQLGLGPVPGRPQHPGLAVPAEDVPLGELSAGGDLHHLLGAQLPAEHLGVRHRPVHGHELDLLIAVETAQGENTGLECIILF